MGFGFGFDFCPVELKKYVDSGWVRVRVGLGLGSGLGSAEVKD